LDITKYALRDQAGHLDSGHDMTMGSKQYSSIALVFERSLVQRSIEKLAGEIVDGSDTALYRGAVGVDIEHVHEHADLDGVAIGVRVANFLDGHYAAIGRRKHIEFALR